MEQPSQQHVWRPVGLSQVLPYNTVKVGGYLIHEIYNPHNLFYNPADGGNGADQIVGPGAKFRSGYFQQDDVAFYAQDDFHPIPRIHIIPGLRVVGFSTSYSDQAQRDFKFVSGVVPTSHCALFPQLPGQDPYANVFGSPTVVLSDGTVTTEANAPAGSSTPSPLTRARSAAVTRAAPDSNPPSTHPYTPYDWLTIYGGYDTTYRSPALGGGGGMFQSVNPAFYTLAKGAYSQGGVKVHFTNAPVLRNFITGVNYFHLDYTNQEIDFETAAGVEESGGGNSTYHGVDAFFDADPS